MEESVKSAMIENQNQQAEPRTANTDQNATIHNSSGLSTVQRDNFIKLLAKFISHREAEKKNSEEILFDMFVNEDTDLIPIAKFLAALRTFGLKMSDPRLKEMMHNLRMVHRSTKSEGSPETQNLDRETFKQ